MPTVPNDLTPAEAASALLWLQAMGADELLSETPIDRFAEKQPIARPAATAPPPPARPRPADQQVQGHEEIHRRARAAASLSELTAILESYEGHPLKKTATRHCFLGGAATSRILLISDRPRNEEDRSGKVFADRHEMLAERMLAAIGLRGEADHAQYEQVTLASFMPWRPPGNRPPNEIECRLVLPFIERAIALLQPKLILAMGHLPGQWLAGGADAIQRQRGKWLEIDGIPFLSTFHPETLLKSPGSKRLAWQDLLAFRKKLDEAT